MAKESRSLELEQSGTCWVTLTKSIKRSDIYENFEVEEIFKFDLTTNLGLFIFILGHSTIRKHNNFD